jgi:hypothetical protein
LVFGQARAPAADEQVLVADPSGKRACEILDGVGGVGGMPYTGGRLAGAVQSDPGVGECGFALRA